MNQHVREAEGITSDHPVPVLNHTFLFNLNESRNSNEQPDDIKDIEAHTAYFPASGVRSHKTRSQYNKHYGHNIYITVYTVEPAALFKDPIREIHQSGRHGQTCKCNMNVHDI